MAGLEDRDRADVVLRSGLLSSEKRAAESLRVGVANETEATPSPWAPSASVFVGRRRELELLKARLKQAWDGHGGTVLIGGEPGIGKTRLADKVAAFARTVGLEVVWGRCWEGEGAPAFWPWIQLLRVLATRHRGEDLKRLMGLRGGELAQVVPELREFVPEAGLPAESLDADQARFRLFDSVTAFLKRAAGGQAMVLILEDVHWADRSSLRLLQYLGGEIADASLVVIATYRDSEVARKPALRKVLAELARAGSCERLLLQGFTPVDITEFIRESANVFPAESLVRALHSETEGNPFFVGEIVHLLVASGELGAAWDALPHPLRIPDTVRDVIRRRFDLLSAECRLVLVTAAVLGREFGLHVLRRVNVDLAGKMLRLIDEAIETRIVTRLPSGAGNYRFVHALIRETIYDGLTEEDRARLHCAAGAALEAEGMTPQESSIRSSLLSHHYFRGLPYGDPEKVILWAIRAAEGATEASAHEEAVEHYQKAVAALAFTGADDSRRCDLLLSLGEAQNRAGEVPKARRTFRLAAQLARQLGLVEQLARAALGLGGVFQATGAADSELVRLLEEAISTFGDRSTAHHAKALAGLSIATHFHDTPERRLCLADRAVEMARKVRDPSAELFGLEAMRYALLNPSGLLRRIEIGRNIVLLAQRLADGEAASRGHQRLAADLLELGDVTGFDQEIDHLELLAAELRQPSYRAQSILTRAMRAMMSGGFDQADILAREALHLAERVGDARAISCFWAQKVWSRRDRGGSGELDSILRQGCAQFPALTSWRAALALLLSEVQRVREATELLNAFITSGQLKVPEDAFFLASTSLLAAASGLLDDADRSEVLYRALLPYRERHVVVGLAGVWLGPVTHYLGILAATMRNWETAETHFNDALRACDAIGARPLATRTRYEWGKMLAACGERHSARERLDEAAVEFERLGMTVCLERATAELRALGNAHPPSDASPPRSGAETVSRMADAPRPIGSLGGGACAFRREGDYWTLAYGEKVSRLKRRRGFEIIAHLLRRPHQPVHSIDLAALAVADRYEGDEWGLAEEGLQVADVDAGGGLQDPILDRRARSQYRARLRELRAELDEAERSNDPGRAERAGLEMEVLRKHLAASLRPGGGARRYASMAERARVSVRNSIRNAVRVIGAHDQGLQRHLANSIKTGMVCSYAPESLPAWKL
jgi:predicted ATPase